MKAEQISALGTFDYIGPLNDRKRPCASRGDLVVRIRAAGTHLFDDRPGDEGPVRARRYALPPALRGGIAGTVEAVARGVAGFVPGDEVFGITMPHAVRAGAEVAVVNASKVARKPRRLTCEAAAAIPVIGVLAWQMLFRHARLNNGETVVVLGAESIIGAFVVQLARSYGLWTVALCSPKHHRALRALGADRVIDASPGLLEQECMRAGAVIDAMGGMLQRRALAGLTSGSALVSCVSRPDDSIIVGTSVKCGFALAEVSTRDLEQLAWLVDAGLVTTNLETLLWPQGTASA